MSAAERLGRSISPTGVVVLIDPDSTDAWTRFEESVVEEAIAEPGHAIFEADGAPIAAAAAVPERTWLRVHGHRPEVPGDSWAEITITWNRPRVAVATETVGRIATPTSTLLVAELSSVWGWFDDEPVDDLADIVAWGRDASFVAEWLEAIDSGKGYCVRPNVTMEEALERELTLDALRRMPDRQFHYETRFHTPQWSMEEQISRTPTASGTVDLNGCPVCGFSTTWDTDLVEVSKDLDRRGFPIRLRLRPVEG